MAIREILVLGNPKLYEVCAEVKQEELSELQLPIRDLEDTFYDFRKRHGFGRAIAAPQIGFMKRVIFMCVDEPIVMINPVLYDKSDEMMELWDDCMSFPNLLVKVKRHRSCKIKYHDMNWQSQEMTLENGLSELLQHEYDHLDGILAVMRAIDDKSFAFTSQKQLLEL